LLYNFVFVLPYFFFSFFPFCFEAFLFLFLRVVEVSRVAIFMFFCYFSYYLQCPIYTSIAFSESYLLCHKSLSLLGCGLVWEEKGYNSRYLPNLGLPKVSVLSDDNTKNITNTDMKTFYPKSFRCSVRLLHLAQVVSDPFSHVDHEDTRNRGKKRTGMYRTPSLTLYLPIYIAS